MIETDLLSAFMLDSDNLLMALERGVTPEWFGEGGSTLFKHLAKASSETKWGERNSVAVLQGVGIFGKCPEAMEIADAIPSWAFKVEDVGNAIEVLAQEHSGRLLSDRLTTSRSRLARGDDVYTVAGDLQGVAEEIDTLSGISTETTEEVAEEAYELDKKIAEGACMGLPFPWANFQARTFGVPFRAVVPMGGRDGAKKSRLAQFLTHFWIKRGIPILYCSVEDGKKRLLSNIASTEGGYDMFTIKRDHVPEDFMPRHKEMLRRVGKMPLYVCEKPTTVERLTSTVAKFDRKARADGHKDGLMGVVVDGFKDIIHSVGESENAKVNHITAKLVCISKEYDVSIIPISHINKIENDRWITKENITGAGNQFKSARMTLMFQDAIPPDMQAEYGAYGDEIILDASKTSYGNKAIVCLRPVLEEGRFEEVYKLNQGEG